MFSVHYALSCHKQSHTSYIFVYMQLCNMRAELHVHATQLQELIQGNHCVVMFVKGTLLH